MALVEEASTSYQAGASIPRAASNLELLSQTAAWKNELEKNPARISPAEFQTKYPCPTTPTMPITSGNSPRVTKSPDRPSTKPVKSAPLVSKLSLSSQPAVATSSSSSWSESWNSVLYPHPLGHESSGCYEDPNKESTTPFMPMPPKLGRHETAMQAAFAPPPGSRKRGPPEEERTLAATPEIHRPVALRSTPTRSFDSMQSLPPWTNHSPRQDPMVEELARDNALLRHDLAEKSSFVEIMQRKIQELESQVAELRQLPVGKISQIPVA